jgi:hypothetical protein
MPACAAAGSAGEHFGQVQIQAGRVELRDGAAGAIAVDVPGGMAAGLLLQIPEQRVLGLRPGNHDRPVREIDGAGAAVAVALQDERDALAAAHARREDAGAGGGRGQLPLLVESRTLAAWALAEARIDLEDRNRGGEDERKRTRSPGLVAEIENPAIGLLRNVQLVAPRGLGDALDVRRIAFAGKKLGIGTEAQPADLIVLAGVQRLDANATLALIGAARAGGGVVRANGQDCEEATKCGEGVR